MSDKKRRTVTTIESHEVWIVRKVRPGVADPAETLAPLEIPQTAAVSPFIGLNDNEETKQEDEL
jgi:hypothetical protein